jgi:hypothetical protein
VTVEKSGITYFIIQNKPGVDRVSRVGCGGASVFVCLFVCLFVGHARFDQWYSRN